MLSHYSAISDRLPALAAERRELLRGPNHRTDSFATERRTEIDYQIRNLLRRHEMVRDAILAVYAAIATFIISMFFIAAAAAAASIWLAVTALVCFLIGTAILFFGIIITLQELRISQRAVHYEVQRALN